MKNLLVLAVSSLLVGAVAAATPVVRTAAGAASYGIVPGSFQNGDFFVEACCGEPNVGDATEEWTSWSFSYVADPRYAEMLAWSTLSRAELRLVYRTGGDTPADDVINGSTGVLAPFGFATTFANYDVTLDLLALGAGSSLLAALRTNGQLGFQMGNDSSPYTATLSLEGIAPVSDTTSMSMMLLGLLVVVATKHARNGSNADEGTQ